MSMFIVGWPFLCHDGVDPERFQGTVYQAANWLRLGETQGFRRTRQGYSPTAQSPKRVFVKPLQADARRVLSRRLLDTTYRTGVPKIMLSAEQMRTLPEFFADIPDPRRAQGRRHLLPAVLGIAAGAILCGMRGYKGIADWAQSLSPKARERFRCRGKGGRYCAPSESIIRDCLIRVDPRYLDQALQRWNAVYGEADESLAIDGKTMCNAINAQGHQAHIMGVVGHQTKTVTPKKSRRPTHKGRLRTEIKMAIPLLDAIVIEGKDISADALLTQREFARYLVEDRQAHYHFTVKGNQPTLLQDLARFFQDRNEPQFVEHTHPFRAWADRNPKDLGYHRTQPLPRLPSRRSGLRHRTGSDRKEDRETLP